MFSAVLPYWQKAFPFPLKVPEAMSETLGTPRDSRAYLLGGICYSPRGTPVTRPVPLPLQLPLQLDSTSDAVLKQTVSPPKNR